ncbi:hypothetical protein B7486_53065 [cyanobacterium TDX16]|nr:hypothetical protein B7486_53065 [cyanobacterium TDX16]
MMGFVLGDLAALGLLRRAHHQPPSAALNTFLPGRRTSSAPSAAYGRCDVKSPAPQLGVTSLVGQPGLLAPHRRTANG